MIFPKLHVLLEHVRTESNLLPALWGLNVCVNEARSNQFKEEGLRRLILARLTSLDGSRSLE